MGIVGKRYTGKKKFFRLEKILPYGRTREKGDSFPPVQKTLSPVPALTGG